jgi:hypothetical protein
MGALLLLQNVTLSAASAQTSTIDGAQLEAQRVAWIKRMTSGWARVKLTLIKVLGAMQWVIFLGTICLGIQMPGEQLSIYALLVGVVVSAAVLLLALNSVIPPVSRRNVVLLSAVVVLLGIAIPAGLGAGLNPMWSLVTIFIGSYAYTVFLEWCICLDDPFPTKRNS